MINTTKLNAYISLTRINKPVGIFLVLWPALFALWLAADGFPGWHLLIVFSLGALLMRCAGCVINDYADRKFDGNVARTCHRPIASGLISTKAALIFFTILCLLAFSLVLTLNTLTIIWSLGAVILASIYPFMKRYTFWPQAFLGAAFAWAVPMAFVAVNESLPSSSWVVFASVMVWAIIYDTAYAIGDKDDDLKIGIKSTAILFGKHTNKIIGLFQLIMLSLLLWIGQLFSLAIIYHLSLIIVLAIFIYHQYLLAQQDNKLAFKVFLTNHWVFLVLLLALVLEESFA